MTALQRSSVSFRRQGSSGLIWDERIIRDPVNGLSTTGREEEKNVASNGRFREETVHKRNPSTPIKANNNVQQKHKPQRCGLSAIFGRCGGS
ncbi:hypothetical protein LWI28_025792 [Acer negundo]|uniref:MAPK kinase substrate protein n=1 Tax=Acer negundo TaxID=4023 RepID=A0AAD5NFN3_ACENE|nr:hypothetical protein LWI28_025792 [Acer negundo]KAK4834463.1 hypothetical protein QYF36_023300 [Acer negundo]